MTDPAGQKGGSRWPSTLLTGSREAVCIHAEDKGNLCKGFLFPPHPLFLSKPVTVLPGVDWTRGNN